MTFTGNKYGQTDPSAKQQAQIDKFKKQHDLDGMRYMKGDLQANKNNPFAAHDHALVVQAFEVGAADWAEEDYALAYHYKDVYSTRNFSNRVVEQMNEYPGVHQNMPSKEDAFRKNAERLEERRHDFWNGAMDNPEAFMSGVRSRQQDFDYKDIFGTDKSAEEKARQLGNLLTDCIPCFDRLLDAKLLLPNADLLEIHALNIKFRTDLLGQINDLFNSPGMSIDICELLKLLTSLCPQDLFMMIILFTQYLAKLNLDIKFNIDFIINLVGAILSPFLNALSGWLDMFIQLLLGPMLCVMDHINEVIITAQSAKIPFSESTVSLKSTSGAALPLHKNVSSGINVGASVPERSLWAEGEFERFQTPNEQKYNPEVPEYPTEETKYASETARASWSEEKTKERQIAEDKARKEGKTSELDKFKARERERKAKDNTVERSKRDGSRWSKDDIPASEKDEHSFSSKYHAPEKHRPPKTADKYMDISPLVNSIVQMRNILQGSIRYIQDWFDYITQMIFDLLGVEFGWMSKKRDNSYIKSSLIQMILMIKSILQAVSKNGLKCGMNTNFDEAQMKYVLESGLNNLGFTQYSVLDNGTIRIVPPGSTSIPDVKGIIEQQREADIATGIGNVKGTAKTDEVKQKTIESGIIIKNCLRDVTADELTDARSWIADYERRASDNG